MTTAGDALFIQPAARPEAASARKDVSAVDDTGVSFADVLDAETDAVEDVSPAAAAAAQPATPPAPPPSQQNTALGTILTALQTINAEPTPDAANAGTAEGAAAQAGATPDAGALLAQPEAQSNATSTQAVIVAAVAAHAMPAMAAKAPVEGAATKEAGKGDADSDDATASDTANGLVLGLITAPVVAETAPMADQPDATAISMATNAAPKTTPAGKPAGTEVPQAADASSSNTSTPAGETKIAQPAASGAAASPSAAAINTQSAEASTADVKVDVAQTSSSTSTSMADALTARGPTAETGAAKPAPALANAPAAVAQVYTRFIERFDGRAQRFEIRLDPVELGQVDVRIEIGADKKVHAVLAAHDSAALGDLMKGQRALERALSDAGIDLADGGLQFELSKDSGRGLADNQQNNEAGNGRANTTVWRGFSALDIPVDTNAADLGVATRTYRRAAARLDVMA